MLVHFSVVRSSFGLMSPGRLIVAGDGDIAVEFGSPNSKSLESINLDFVIERYPGVASVFSAFLFHKSIDDFVYQNAEFLDWRSDKKGTYSLLPNNYQSRRWCCN